jgi:hypothetical protein
MFWNSKDRAARLAGILLFVLAGVVALVTILSLAYRRYNSISLYSRDPITPPFSPNFCRYTLPMAEHRQTSRLLSSPLCCVAHGSILSKKVRFKTVKPVTPECTVVTVRPRQ